MSATVGPEDLLTQELLAVLQGKAPATEQWKKGYSAARTLDPDYSGSCNIPLLGAAIRLRLLGDNVDDWRDFFAASHGRWMGIETGSRIYASWHFLAVAAVAEHPKLRDAALGWLSFGVDLLRRMQAPDGRLLLVGQRSAGHAPDPGLWEWIAATIFGGDVARAEAWCKQFGVGLKQRWEYSALKILLPTFQAAAAMPPEPHEVLSPYHFAEGNGWRAVWTERNLNPNTPPVLGVLWTPAAIQWLPDNGGARIREQFDHATCELAQDGRSLVYVSSLYGGATLVLPAPAAQEPPGAPISPPDPPAAPKKKESVWTSWL